MREIPTDFINFTPRQTTDFEEIALELGLEDEVGGGLMELIKSYVAYLKYNATSHFILHLLDERKTLRDINQFLLRDRKNVEKMIKELVKIHLVSDHDTTGPFQKIQDVISGKEIQKEAVKAYERTILGDAVLKYFPFNIGDEIVKRDERITELEAQIADLKKENRRLAK